MTALMILLIRLDGDNVIILWQDVLHLEIRVIGCVHGSIGPIN